MKTKKPNRPKRAKKAAVGRVMYYDGDERVYPKDVGLACGYPPVLVIDLTSPEEYAKARETLRAEIVGVLPTNWLDSILTGPDAFTKKQGGTWGCPEVERLINLLREKQLAALDNILAALGWPSPSVSAKRVKSGVRK